MADYSAAEPPSICCEDRLFEKQPGVSARSGARNLDGDGYAQGVATISKCLDVLPPVLVIEVYAEKAAGVVR